jgi:predicted Zn-dependent peptidase
MNDAKASQSIVYGYIPGSINDDAQSHQDVMLFNNYFGGSMSSLLFQEIREFRSMAYRVNAIYNISPLSRKDKPGYLNMRLSTQCDKTFDAMSLLDSLVREMPLKPERVETSRFEMINAAHNQYPAFRDISTKVASLKTAGHDCDPNIALVETAANMDINNIANFYNKNVKGRPIAWIVVGNSAKIDMAKLAIFGKIVTVKPEEIFR